MITIVTIKNFKSIKNLTFNAKRINLFLGKPNTGKSNILESLGIFFLPHKTDLKELVRCDGVINIFYNYQTSLEIEVSCLPFKWKIFTKGDSFQFEEDFQRSRIYTGVIYPDGIITGHQKDDSFFKTFIIPFKLYRFPSSIPRTFYQTLPFFLWPPYGENLFTILLTNQDIYNLINSLLKEFSLEILLDEAESKIRILSHGEKRVLYPWSILSDTLQRTIFYLVAIKSNKNSIILLEEPEAHAFPYYTKIIAESIVNDPLSNQYFISTHNPYFLLTILEKSKKEEVAIFWTEFIEGETKIKELSEEDKEKILERGMDVFFNLVIL
ncbi:MAG: AAA family ATPase [candidate division WOR-3 bacterium]